MMKLDVKILVALVFKVASDMHYLSPPKTMSYHSNRHGHYLRSSEGQPLGA